ncbi:MAG: VanW family protein [uncultured bacterium]|nr:MAG: VanW family protein [uncultured bacterium]HBD05182.1 hypothetical protein [Candidatus Uhrbacteria bacterium]
MKQDNPKKHSDNPRHSRPKWLFSRATIATVLVSITSIAVFCLSSLAQANSYSGKIPPGVSIASIDMRGYTKEQAQNILYARIDGLVSKGLPVIYNGRTETIQLTQQGASDPDVAQDLIQFDIDSAVLQAVAYGESNSLTNRAVLILKNRINPKSIPLTVAINSEKIEAEIIKAFPVLADKAQNAGFKFEKNEKNEWTAAITQSKEGIKADMESFDSRLGKMMSNLSLEPIELSAWNQAPDVNEWRAQEFIDEALSALQSAPYALKYEPNRFESKNWKLEAEMLAESIALISDESGNIKIGLNKIGLEKLLTEIDQTITVAPIDARFDIRDGRVVEFQTAQDGISFDKDETIINIEAILGQKNSSAQIAFDTDEPNIQNKDANDLGIQEVLGIGISNFSGSPQNRIKNIRHGISKLNGLLIKPGEEFSLLGALRPFTMEDGYFPELVIKGDKIEPEVAGGLCQLGTTTFRATMNSGLPITKRQNHSLVVNYYNDPSNNSPGTDATIYDPAPDFKFINDTGNYILFTANMDTKTGELKFTFWGTADKRKGSYTPPVVKNWIPAGPTQYIKTTELEPGKEKCQGAHVGANTSFKYTIERPDGTKEETVYESHYRPLPKICLVGATQEELDQQTAVDQSQTDQSQTEPLAPQDQPPVVIE